MVFASTRDSGRRVSFREAVFTGLAPDGGLFHPLEKPDLTHLFRELRGNPTFLEIATEVTAALFPDEIGRAGAEEICSRAFDFSPKIRPVTGGISVLELFHGPSCAFKDFGASFLASSMEYFLKSEKRRAVILTATSGDTGSAVARAFHGKDSIDVVILYPSGRVSPLQEKQLTTAGGNVHALEVLGSFDDCQRMVKEAFTDPLLSRDIPLTSANSINLGRLIPQSYYYIWAALREPRDMPPCFSVPSGNFGNLTAGVLAREWGLEVEKFIAATNINDVVPEYLKHRIFTPRPSVRTYSNAMDVGNPSNFERLLAIFENEWTRMRNTLEEEVVTDDETVETIRRLYRETGSFLDPHTAVGYLAAERFLRRSGNRDRRIITLATAHPGKFREIVEKATGETVPLPPQLEAVLSLEKQSTVIENTKEGLGDFLRGEFS
ncbi:MAG: threonine synthase [Spirochaetia bacterium]